MARHDHLREVRVRAEQISELSRELIDYASAAHTSGASWSSIAAAMDGHWPNGSPAALGDLLPGGRSVTTVRGYVLSRTPRAVRS